MHISIMVQEILDFSARFNRGCGDWMRRLAMAGVRENAGAAKRRGHLYALVLDPIESEKDEGASPPDIAHSGDTDDEADGLCPISIRWQQSQQV